MSTKEPDLLIYDDNGTPPDALFEHRIASHKKERKEFNDWLDSMMRGQKSSVATGAAWLAWQHQQSRIDALEHHVKELREALQKYGSHEQKCDFAFDDLPCTCGFSKALVWQVSK
jgi:uncharacterized protein YicC (UPF0701 family)